MPKQPQNCANARAVLIADQILLMGNILVSLPMKIFIFSQIAEGLERVWEHSEHLEEIGLQAHKDALAFLPEHPGKALFQNVMQVIREPPKLP